MRKIVLLAVIVTLLPGAVRAAAEDSPTPATCSVDSVVANFFAALRSGAPSEAAALFRVQSEAQKQAAGLIIARGVSFFSTNQLQTRTLEVFTAGPYALCALEQKSLTQPSHQSVEMACLIKQANCWRFLPQPQDYTAPVNNLTPQEISTYNLLQNRYATYKKDYQEYQSHNPHQ